MYRFSNDTFHLDEFLWALQKTDARRLVLFGAGGYGEVLYQELRRRGISRTMVFADNDATKQGRRLIGAPILGPDDLDPSADWVAITSISAGESISRQLEAAGFVRGCTYFEIMRQLSPNLAFSEIAFFSKYIDTFFGLSVMHVGPGGQLCTELLLRGLGAGSVVSVEYHSFRLQYPDITSVWPFYRRFAEDAKARLGTDLYEHGILHQQNGRWRIDTNQINLCHPCSVTALPFKENCFDLVLHHAVFEHVPDPERGYQEIFRVLKPGGMTVGLVDPQDHRSFASLADYHPLKFLEYSRDRWQDIAAKINYHNRVTTPEHRKMIRGCGFTIGRWDPLMEMPVTHGMRSRFHPDFQNLDPADLGVLRFGFAATKPQAGSCPGKVNGHGKGGPV